MLFVLAAFMVVFLCVFASAGHDHIYDGENKPATLTEDGHAEMRCQICGYVFEDRVVPKIASVKLEIQNTVFKGKRKVTFLSRFRGQSSFRRRHGFHHPARSVLASKEETQTQEQAANTQTFLQHKPSQLPFLRIPRILFFLL